MIASGGVARLEDLDATRKSGAFAVIIGKAIYERVFTVEEAIKRAHRLRLPRSSNTQDVMLAKRIIPCLDVADGRVKGRAVSGAARRG